MPDSSVLKWVSIAAAGVVVAVVAFLLIGGGDGKDSDAPLEIRSDNIEKGDPELGADRIRITPKGLWTPVFWVPLENLEAGQRVGGRVNIQVTNCRPSDRARGSGSSCIGTAAYPFDVEVDWKLVLADEDGDSDRPKTSGTNLTRPQRMDCTKQLHHCVPVALGETEIEKADEGDKYVAMVVRATNPKARSCAPAKPADCNVLQLTQGQGRLGVARVIDPSEIKPPSHLTTKQELADKLEIAQSGNQKKSRRYSVYSVEIKQPGPLLIEGRLGAYFDESEPIPPLVSKELILADSPKAISGDTVAPQNGENCSGECHYLQLGVAPCVTAADLAAGKRYLNLIAFSARESAFAKGSKPVAIEDGGYLDAAQYDASLSSACG